MCRVFGILWASPISLAGLMVAVANAIGGGTIRRHGLALEATGGFLKHALRESGFGRPIAAITLGHVILASSSEDARRWRRHEHVHVRQYERWGMLFPVAYLAASALAWHRGSDAYWGNAFEVAAREEQLDS